jgi:hypothetical protein
LGSQELRELAIETGFCQRMSKLTPEIFFDLLFYAVSLSQNSSLEYLTSYLESMYGITLRKQSLDERFSERTVNFVKTVLTRLIGEQFSDILYDDSFLKSYNHVRIKDSTTFKVPSNLAVQYRGNGGCGTCSLAGINIQYEFDLKTGKFLDLTINEAVRNDQRDASETAANIEENDLIIRDLGYFSTSVLQKIHDQKAFYLSRHLSSTSVYDENGEEIDFKKYYAFMTKNGIDKLEKQVFIGRDKTPVRLVIGLVPDEVYQTRIRRKVKEEKRRGRIMKDKTKFIQHFNLFVTNVDAGKLPSHKVMPLYRFRWQVELMFKNWKSIFSIHALQKMKVERYITMLYIRLILIVVNLQLIYRVQSAISKQGEKDAVLSVRKALQTLKNNFTEILSILRCNQEKSIELLGKIHLILSKNHWREERKKSENFIDNIYLFICTTNK